MRGIKRVFDITVSLFIIVISSPLLLITYYIVFRRLGSPTIFKQQRPGLHGKPFNVYKFRTMTYEKNENGELLPDHMRLPRVGKFIRKFSLDELPQLFNVMKGDISLVGPRPLLMEYLPLYTSEQGRRHDVRPGITGWAQVNGRNAISWEEKFELDVWYVDNQSFWLDIRILFLTVLKVFKSEGINQDGQVTVEKFQGSPEKRKLGNE